MNPLLISQLESSIFRARRYNHSDGRVHRSISIRSISPPLIDAMSVVMSAIMIFKHASGIREMHKDDKNGKAKIQTLTRVLFLALVMTV